MARNQRFNPIRKRKRRSRTSLAALQDMFKMSYRTRYGLILTILVVTVALFLRIQVSLPFKSQSIRDIPEQGNCVGQERRYKDAAVAADANYCSTIGTNILYNDRGSAIDAAIATMICLGVANAHSMGIGGGFFMTSYHRESGEIFSVNARDRAPGAANETMYVHDLDLSLKGGLSIAVPGEIKGYWEMHQKYGKVPWRELFEPTIKLCEEGVPVTHGLHLAAEMVKSAVHASKDLSELFINPVTNDTYQTGDRIKRPKLAKTLRTIAREGASAFYTGSLAKDIIEDIKDNDGIITLQDLKNYRVTIDDHLVLKLKNGLNMITMKPPSSGIILQLILRVMEGYNLTREDFHGSDEKVILALHRWIETLKFAYAQRNLLGDPEFVNINDAMEKLKSQELVDSIRAKIADDKTYEPSYYGNVTAKISSTGTSHLSIIAPNGDAVSATSTINHFFGSKVVGKRTGIIFNDGMDDFSTPDLPNGFGFPPSPENFIKPGKRPMSSMTPLIITDKNGEVILVDGASGGAKIISGVAHTVARLLWAGDTVKQALDSQRLHHQWIPNKIIYEREFDKNHLKGLSAKGHKIEKITGRGSVVQALHVKDGDICAYCDIRKGGCPDGL